MGFTLQEIDFEDFATHYEDLIDDGMKNMSERGVPTLIVRKLLTCFWPALRVLN